MFTIMVLFDSQNELQKTFWTLGESLSTNGENCVSEKGYGWSDAIQCLLKQSNEMVFKAALHTQCLECFSKDMRMPCLSNQHNAIFVKAKLCNVFSNQHYAINWLENQHYTMFVKAKQCNVCQINAMQLMFFKAVKNMS